MTNSPEELSPQIRFAQLLQEDRRYRAEAYFFVWEALSFAQQELGMGQETPSEPLQPEAEEPEPDADVVKQHPQRHVTGQELCEAIRQYALRQFGFMAKTVLNSWGVQKTGDFGDIVFNLLRIGHMRKTKHDRREDFDNIYDFDTAFEQGFRFTPDE
jgi:uncharacterized repeat protein (TIGR04138 family)